MSDVSNLVAGLDVGTTAVKAAVFDLADPSTPVAVSRTESATHAPRPGWSEANPARVMEKVRECLTAVANEVDASRLGALGVSGTACGAWLVDTHARPVRDAILWNDGRAVDVVAGWVADGTTKEIFRRSGNVPFPGYTLPVLRWLSEHEPDSLAAASSVLCAKDWIRSQLTGVVTFEESDASYVPFNMHQRDWDASLLELCGVEQHARLLPPLSEPHRVDPLLTEFADSVGLPRELPVALGATDIIAGCVGGGAMEAGQALTILGTSANSTVITDAPLLEPEMIGITAAAPLGRYARTMVNQSGSTTLDWMARLLTDGDVGRLLELASQSGESRLRPVLLPYLANTGVVSPFVDPNARGVLAGLRIDDGPAEVARAAVDGLAFAVADCYGAMPTPVVEMTAIGGAARSDLLLQTIADATAARVTCPQGEELGARGVALLAAWATGLLPDDDALLHAARSLRPDRVFEPRTTSPVHDGLHRYRNTSNAVRPLWEQW